MLSCIPKPNHAAFDHAASFHIPNELLVDTGDFPVSAVTAFAERMNFAKIVTAKDTLGNPWLVLSKKAPLSTEGYQLTVSPEGISIAASQEQGIIWGLTTLYQMMDVNGNVACATISDAPKYAHRGVHLDCARHFFSSNEVRKVIEGISLGKMNVLHWHLSDDQGFRIQSFRFPALGEVSKDFYTQDEIRDIVSYAAVRGVEILPEIDMPGHTSSLLAAYPYLSCRKQPVTLAQSGGIYPVILCGGSDDTYLFLEELLDEILPLFPSKRFHIGGDEAPKKEWKKCPVCQMKMKELGLTNLEDLQGYFSNRIIEVLKKHGKSPVCWNDSLNASNISRDVQIQYWSLEHADRMYPFIENGGSFIYSDMFELYFDYPNAMTPVEKICRMIPNINDVPCADAPGFLGMECCLWTEYVMTNERLEYLLFPRVYAVVEMAWCGINDYRDFLSRLEMFFEKHIPENLNWAPREAWNPKGNLRKNELKSYAKSMSSGMSAQVRKETMENAAVSKDFTRNFITKQICSGLLRCC